MTSEHGLGIVGGSLDSEDSGYGGAMSPRPTFCSAVMLIPRIALWRLPLSLKEGYAGNGERRHRCI
jgi:hypothetical protein